MELKFKEIETYHSQRTIVKILKKYNYRFVPVNEYDNNYFVCMLKCTSCDAFVDFFRKCLGKLGIKTKPRAVEVPLQLEVYGCNEAPIVVPMVFDKQELVAIVTDVPETYIGENIL